MLTIPPPKSVELPLPPPSPAVKQPKLVRYSQHTKRPTQWLWPQRIALGRLTLLVGEPGLGKGSVAADLAARVSRGSAWPDQPQASAPLGTTIVVLGQPLPTPNPDSSDPEMDFEEPIDLHLSELPLAGALLPDHDTPVVVCEGSALERAGALVAAPHHGPSQRSPPGDPLSARPLPPNTKALLPAGTKWRDRTQYKRCEIKTPNRLYCRRVNCSALLGHALLKLLDDYARQTCSFLCMFNGHTY